MDWAASKDISRRTTSQGVLRRLHFMQLADTACWWCSKRVHRLWCLRVWELLLVQVASRLRVARPVPRHRLDLLIELLVFVLLSLNLFFAEEKEAIVKLFELELALSLLDAFLFQKLTEGKLLCDSFDSFRSVFPKDFIVDVKLESAHAALFEPVAACLGNQALCNPVVRLGPSRGQFGRIEVLVVCSRGLCHFARSLISTLTDSVLQCLQIRQIIYIDILILGLVLVLVSWVINFL